MNHWLFIAPAYGLAIGLPGWLAIAAGLRLRAVRRRWRAIEDGGR